MAKRKKRSNASPTAAADASASPVQEPAAKPTRKSPRKTTAKSARRSSRKPRAKKYLSRGDRRRILAEAKSKGWTAAQIALKAGVSKWTVYGWKSKRGAMSRGTPVKRGRPGRPTRQVAGGSLAEMLRPLIAQMVREELARLVG